MIEHVSMLKLILSNSDLVDRQARSDRESDVKA